MYMYVFAANFKDGVGLFNFSARCSKAISFFLHIRLRSTGPNTL